MSLWRKHAWIAYLAVLIGVLGHASTEFVAVLSGVQGPELSVWRFLLGSAGLVLLTQLFPDSRNLLAPFKTHGIQILTLSILGITIGYLAFHWALDFATVPQVATTVTTMPIFVAIASARLNQQKVPAARLLSGIAAIFGLALLITDGYLAQLAGSGKNLIGVLLAVTCAVTVGLYTLLIRPIIAEHGALRITAVTMFIGALGLWLLVGTAWGIWVNPLTLFQREAGESNALLTIAFWNTTITQFLWIGGLAAVPDITRGTYLFFLKPVIAVLLTLAFLGQEVTSIQMLAILIVCSSVLIEANWEKLKARFAFC